MAEFSKFKFQVERFPAIEHPSGARGCANSHLLLYRQNTHRTSIMVFEDDVHFRGPFTHVDFALARLPSDWDLVYLGGAVFPDEVNDQQIAPFLFKAKNVVCTHAIGISQKGMRRIISDYHFIKHGPIDEFYRSVIQPSGTAYVVAPMIAEQRPGMSDITHKYGGANNLLDSTNQKFKHHATKKD